MYSSKTNIKTNEKQVMSQAVPTIAARKQFFETADELGRTFMHLAAISG